MLREAAAFPGVSSATLSMKLSSLAFLLLCGCSSSSSPPSSAASPDASSDAPVGPASVAIACNDNVADVYVTPSSLPAMTDALRGAIVRCAMDGVASVSALSSALTTAGVSGVTLTTGVTKVRIAYRTYRSGTTPGVGSAEVWLPDQLEPGAPVIVVAHGTAGLAPTCAPSQANPPITEVQSLSLPYAGSGYIVVAPDYAGLGTAGVQGYQIADDTVHSLLDAARAVHNLVDPGKASRPVVITGHSEGGQATLLGQAYARSYYPEGNVIAVVAESAAWTRNVDADLKTAMGNPSAPITGPVGAITFLGLSAAAANVLGPTHELDYFAPAHRAALQSLVDSQCVGPLITLLPKVTPTLSDLLDPTFQTTLTKCLAGGACDEPGKGYLAEEEASNADLKADPAGPPILLLQGLMDTVVTPSDAACTIASLEQQGVKPPQLCTYPSAQHDTTPETAAPFALEWVEALWRGTALPTCDGAGLPKCGGM